ncbi:MAG: hypothetical protein KTR31_06760 [Myxococcales bacterium]|nr:hypothetical protein [Myxococcales bacterium]
MASILALAVAGLTSTASANHGRAYVEIDNRFAGEAVVYANGRYVGEIAGNTCERFRISVGRSHIEVRRRGSGFVLASDRIDVGYGDAVMVRVHTPLSSLRVANRGDAALRLQAADRSVWLSPGAVQVIDVPAGFVPVTAMMKDPRGEFVYRSDRVWVEPGRIETEVLRPDPAMLRVVNREDVPVRLFVDGASAALLRPGEVEHVVMRPGSASVELVDPRGRTRLARQVYLHDGQSSSVVLLDRHRGRRYSGRQVTYTSRHDGHPGPGHHGRHRGHRWDDDDDSSEDDRYGRRGDDDDSSDDDRRRPRGR